MQWHGAILHKTHSHERESAWESGAQGTHTHARKHVCVCASIHKLEYTHTFSASRSPSLVFSPLFVAYTYNYNHTHKTAAGRTLLIAHHLYAACLRIPVAFVLPTYFHTQTMRTHAAHAINTRYTLQIDRGAAGSSTRLFWLPCLLTAWVVFWHCLLSALAQYGQLPLHRATSNEAGLGVVSVLLKAYPDAAEKADEVRGEIVWIQWACGVLCVRHTHICV